MIALVDNGRNKFILLTLSVKKIQKKNSTNKFIECVPVKFQL